MLCHFSSVQFRSRLGVGDDSYGIGVGVFEKERLHRKNRVCYAVHITLSPSAIFRFLSRALHFQASENVSFFWFIARLLLLNEWWMAIFHSAIIYRYMLLLLSTVGDPYLQTKLRLSQEEHKLCSNFCLQFPICGRETYNTRKKPNTNIIKAYEYEIYQKIH